MTAMDGDSELEPIQPKPEVVRIHVDIKTVNLSGRKDDGNLI